MADVDWDAVMAGARELDAREFGGKPADSNGKSSPDLYEQRLAWHRADRKARLAVEDEERKARAAPIPPRQILTDLLAKDIPGERWLIEGLWQAEGRALLAAQAKAGKTTIAHNLLRSLCDGDKFLDMWTVARRPEFITYLDFELSERQAQEWLQGQGIKNHGRVDYRTMRQHKKSFEILSTEGRRDWAESLKGTEVLILDCIGPALAAAGVDESSPFQARQFLDALDDLIGMAGMSSAIVIHHMGHNGERSRGASALRDWPDAEWKLLRQDADDMASARFFSAYGRDVEVWKTALEFDPRTRRLAATGESPREAKDRATEECVLEALAGGEMSGRELAEALRGKVGKQAATDTAKAMAARGQISHRKGQRGADLYALRE